VEILEIVADFVLDPTSASCSSAGEQRRFRAAGAWHLLSGILLSVMIVNMQLSGHEFEHATDVFTDESLFRAADRACFFFIGYIVLVMNLWQCIQTQFSVSPFFLSRRCPLLGRFLLSFGFTRG
jgi:hypothetical protein